MTVSREGFVQVLTNAFAGMGFPQEAAHVALPYKMYLPDADLGVVSESIDGLINGLTRWQPKTKAKKVIVEPDKIVVRADSYDQALTKMNALFIKSLWGDGFALLPPTEERVSWILTGTDLSPDKIVARIMPKGGVATVRVIAVCLAMAGGRPEYMPVLLAAVEAIVNHQFRHPQVQATTCSIFPVIIVNGSVAREIGINSGHGCLGPDPAHPAGASIGRAIRLLLQNVGGAIPGSGSMAGFGGPGKYTNVVFAEDEEDLPADWEPLNVERGSPRGSNTVTVYAASGTANCAGSAAETEEAALWTLYALAGFMRVPNRQYFGSGYTRPPGIVLMGAVTAQGFSKLGWSKHKIKSFLWENSKMPLAQLMKEGCGYSEEKLAAAKEYWQDPMPITSDPDRIMIVVAGGDKSRHNYWMQAGRGPEGCGSAEVRLPSNWGDLLKKAEEGL
ncbi:MAG: hypothetical protein HYX90_01715 [Chloroflexi bacterium]|nr:hypothetical protein [Chloroflexota bacterium]